MKHLMLLMASLIAIATVVDAWCGTTNPHSHGKATCIKNDCDTEQGRAPYYYTKGAQVYNITVNSILFGNYYNDTDLNKRYNDSMVSFKAKYLSMLGIDLTIRSTFVTDEYQDVPDRNIDMHKEMADKYYRPGELTLMFTKFRYEVLYGYALFPWLIDYQDLSSYYAIITNTPGILSADNTTIIHEVGHMLGLLHVFNEDDDCSDCIERPSSPDRNVVGDFCNDTLPMRIERNCNGNLNYTQNCKGESFASIDQLPVNNYMAYTPDDCQTLGFTPQQIARARCYLATQLTFLLDYTPGVYDNSRNSDTPGKSSAAARSSVFNVYTLAVVLSALSLVVSTRVVSSNH